MEFTTSIPLSRYFAPRGPLEWAETPEPPRAPRFDSIARFIGLFERTPPLTPAAPRSLHGLRNKWSIRLEHRKARGDLRATTEAMRWSPATDPNINGSGASTMVLYGLSRVTTEERLRHEVGSPALVRSLRVVRGADGVSRGYAFAVFHSRRDMIAAMQRFHGGRMVDGRSVRADVRRGGIEEGWLPQRLLGPSVARRAALRRPHLRRYEGPAPPAQRVGKVVVRRYDCESSDPKRRKT